MTAPFLPPLIAPAELASRLDAPELLLVDVGSTDLYAQGHLPGAVRLEYGDLLASIPPADGFLPTIERLGDILNAIGLTPAKHVVAYDREGNSRAARFLWTLDAVGHTRHSLLDGGLLAWRQERLAIETQTVAPTPGDYRVTAIDPSVVADKQWILDRLDDPGVLLLDARTEEEYEGSLVRADVGGHIPGAVNYDYSNAIDSNNGLRLKPVSEIRAELLRLGVVPEKEIVVYCQTHHRSAHTYFLLKYLGYPRVRGYPGSWSEWGNDPDLPVES